MSPDKATSATSSKTSGDRASICALRGDSHSRVTPARQLFHTSSTLPGPGADLSHAIEIDSDSDSNESWHSAIDIRSPSPPPVDPTPRLTAQKRRDERRARALARRQQEVIDMAGSSSTDDSENGDDGLRFLGSRDPDSFLKRKRTSRKASPLERGSPRKRTLGDVRGRAGGSSVANLDDDHPGMSIPHSMLSFAMPSGPAVDVPVLQFDVRGTSLAEGIIVEDDILHVDDGGIAEIISDTVDEILDHTGRAGVVAGESQAQARATSAMDMKVEQGFISTTPTASNSPGVDPDLDPSTYSITASSTTSTNPNAAITDGIAASPDATSSRTADKCYVAPERPRRPSTPPLPSEDEDFGDHTDDMASHHEPPAALRGRPLTPPLPSSPEWVNHDSDPTGSYHDSPEPDFDRSLCTGSGQPSRPATPPGTPPPLSSPTERRRPVTPPGLPPCSEPSDFSEPRTSPNQVHVHPVNTARRSSSPVEPCSAFTHTARTATGQTTVPILTHPLPPRPGLESRGATASPISDSLSTREEELKEHLRLRKRVRMKRRPAVTTSTTDDVQWVSQPEPAFTVRASSSDSSIDLDTRGTAAPSLMARMSGHRPTEPLRTTGSNAEVPPLMARISSSSAHNGVAAAATARSALPTQQSGSPRPSLAERMTSKIVGRSAVSSSSANDAARSSSSRTAARPSPGHTLAPRPSLTHTLPSDILPGHIIAQIIDLQHQAAELARKGSTCLRHVEITTSGLSTLIHDTIDAPLTRLGACVLPLDRARLYTGGSSLQGNRFVVMESKSAAYPEGLVAAKKIDYAGLLDLLAERRAREISEAEPRYQNEQDSTLVKHGSPEAQVNARRRRPLHERLGQGSQSSDVSAELDPGPPPVPVSLGSVPLAARIGRQ